VLLVFPDCEFGCVSAHPPINSEPANKANVIKPENGVTDRLPPPL